MLRHAILFIALSSAAFLLGGIGFVLLASVSEVTFGGLFGMYNYHEKHPFQYIGLVAVAFGIVGTVWHWKMGRSNGWQRWLSIVAVMAVTIVVASVPGGTLYMLHDMQAGYFPEAELFWQNLRWGAVQGLCVGWLVVLSSMFYSVPGLIIGAHVLHRLPGMVLREKRRHRRLK